MATVKIILDKRTNRSDDTYSINLQICHNRKTTTRSTKIYVLEKTDWDDESKSIEKSNQQHKLLNIKLKKAYADMQSQLILADDEKVKVVLSPVGQVEEPVVIKKTLYQFVNELIDQQRADNKTGNAWVYESTINAQGVSIPMIFCTLRTSIISSLCSTTASILKGVKHIRFICT